MTNTRKTVSVSPQVHARVMSETKRLKAPNPKALADRIISQALKDKDFYAKIKEYFVK